jgi:L-phenylalanine/L-methionine N-acetyltransferase
MEAFTVNGAATNPAARARPLFRAREASDAGDLLLLFNDRTFVREASTRGAFASAAELNAWLDNIVADQKFEVVASLDNEVIGFGGLYALGDRLSHTGWLTLGVRTDMRRQGVGSTLLRLLLATAERLANLTKVQLTVFVDNAPAIRLYLKSGFEMEGVHRRFVRRDDGYVDAYSMAILFGSSPESAPVR